MHLMPTTTTNNVMPTAQVFSPMHFKTPQRIVYDPHEYIDTDEKQPKAVHESTEAQKYKQKVKLLKPQLLEKDHKIKLLQSQLNDQQHHLHETQLECQQLQKELAEIKSGHNSAQEH